MELKIKDFAAREGVDERTVRRWIRKGMLDTRRTPGGGVRIQVATPGSIAPTLLVLAAPRGVVK